MDVREKLVEILKQAPFEGKVLDEWWWEEKIKRIADHLISNGVTVQEWISVEDKLPPYNHNVLVYRPNMAMKILVDNYGGYYGEDDNEWHEGWKNTEKTHTANLLLHTGHICHSLRKEKEL